nr:hypothetical protein [Tanacetum cinerariifolium]
MELCRLTNDDLYRNEDPCLLFLGDEEDLKRKENKVDEGYAYELLKDEQKKQLGKNNEAKMTLFNALPRKEYERVFMCKTGKEVWHTLIITHQGNSQVKNCKIDILTQEYEKFIISNEETIDSGFTRFNAIVISLKSLDPYYSSKNHVYEMVLDNDGIASKTTKEKFKSLALKVKVTREQTSDYSDSQGGSNEDVDEKEEAEAFNLMARNFRKFFHKGNRFGNGTNRLGRGRKNRFGNKGGESSKQKGARYKKAIFLIVDSGCTKHMTGNRRLFTSYKAYDGGHVVFRSNLKGKVVSEVRFTKLDCAFSKNGKKLAKGHRRNGLYTCILGDNSKQQICLASVVDNSTLWHMRLGHANMRLVQNLASNELVRNLPKLSFERHFCDVCGLGSQEFKDDVLEKFKILCKRLENLHDCSIISNVINHSSEFDKFQFGSFCEQHEMYYNLSNPITSQSSDIVERTHRKLRKMSLAMLDEQSIPQKFWCHALDSETYIFNRVYIRKFINKTPYEILRDGNSSLEYFRVFGCKVLILNTKVHLTKFDPNSYEGVFLGYSQTSKAYIVPNKETMRITESLNVTFDESLPEPKSSHLIEDDRIIEPVVQIWLDLRKENRDMFSYINEVIKLMLFVATNMSCVVENDIGKEGSKDNLKEYDTLKALAMERSEPTFVPEWLKSSGVLSTTSHNSDEQGVSKATRNKSLVNVTDNDLGRPSASERTTSSYFRRTASSNGSSHLRSYSSFGRYSDKEKSENRHRDYSDPLGHILPSRFEKEGLRRSHSSVSAKRGESWPRKVVSDSSSVNKSSLNNGSTLRSGGGAISCVKTAFERDFPSLGSEEKLTDFEIGRVPSPGLSSAIQSLPIGNSTLIGGDGWTSALAEVPVIAGSNGSSGPAVQSVQSTPVSATASMTSGRNMAETLAQGPPRAQTAPQLSVETQRLEELAVKQSRQLIPMTPSMPKALVLNSSDKSKPKVAQLQPLSPHHTNHANSPRAMSTKLDVSKTSTVGKLHVLKPSRERNGVTSITKDNLSPTAGSRLPNSPLAVPSVVGAAPLRIPGNNPPVAAAERKPGDNSSSDAILYSEEEEARFLRSLGWEETAEEEEGLTEEEISSFYRDVSKYLNMQAASKIFKGTQPKLLIPLHSQMGKNGDISSDSKLES